VTEAEDSCRYSIERVVVALGLPGRGKPLPSLAARALLLATPCETSEREHRMIASAHQLATDPNCGRSSSITEQAYLYLALAGCSWAKNASFSQPTRSAALIAAVAFAASASENPRVALGVDDRLNLLALDPDLDVEVRALVSRLGLASHVGPDGLLTGLENALRKATRSKERQTPKGSRSKRTG
jgi:hypothetical protein